MSALIFYAPNFFYGLDNSVFNIITAAFSIAVVGTCITYIFLSGYIIKQLILAVSLIAVETFIGIASLLYFFDKDLPLTKCALNSGLGSILVAYLAYKVLSEKKSKVYAVDKK